MHCSKFSLPGSHGEHHRLAINTEAPCLKRKDCCTSWTTNWLAQPVQKAIFPRRTPPTLGPAMRLRGKARDMRTLPVLARDFKTTGREWMRRCQRDLGMSFAEWRQRLRVVTPIPPLEAGNTVECGAPDLGYGSASAFITKFRRMLRVTPNEFRREGGRVGRSSSVEIDRRAGKPT